MALKSIIGGILHHTCQTQAHCLTMVSSFELSSRTVCLISFVAVGDADMHQCIW